MSIVLNSDQRKSSIQSEFQSVLKEVNALTKIQELNKVLERKDLLVVKDYKLYRLKST